MRRCAVVCLGLVMVLQAAVLAGGGAAAPADRPAAETPAPLSAPPLPFHSVEGMGGAFAVPSAYLVNPGAPGGVFGLPSVGGMHVHLGNGRVLDALTLTETLWGRLELGYGLDHFDAGDLGADIRAATGMTISENAVNLHNLNARFQILSEGQGGRAWVPAVTVGVHYKYNETVNTLDRDLSGTLTAIGIKDNAGWDFTLFASKMINVLPRPVVVTVGARSTEAAHIGLLGFTGERKIVPEATVCAFVADNLLVAAEYRGKPDEYAAIPGLVEREEDWWTLCVGWIVNDRMTLSAGYAHFGRVLNHKANGAWGIALKYEF